MAEHTSTIKAPIKVALPTLTAYKDRLHIRSLLMKRDVPFPAIVVQRVSFTDVFGNTSCRDEFPFIPPGGPHIIDFDFAFEKEPFLRESQITISLLTDIGIKYVVCFHCARHIDPICTFESGTVSLMTKAEQAYFYTKFHEHLNPRPLSAPPPFTPPSAKSSTLEMFKTAVFQEMKFLKNNGGKQYKVSGGKYIGKTHNLYAYRFEMESEVFLADDSPVTVSCMAGTSSGTVLLCDGFDLLLLLEKDLGSAVKSATISVEPWKLLESLNKRIEHFDTLGPIATKLMTDGPKLATKNPASQIQKGQDAAKAHVENSDITVIWGPPGTGKTHTMSEIAISLLQAGKTVLIASHSNISVDGVISKIASLLREQNLEKYLLDGKVLRYGYVRDEQLSQDPYASAYNYALSKSAPLRQQLEQLNKRRDASKKNLGKDSPETLELEEEIKSLRKKIRLEERKYVETAQILATTVSKIHADSLFEQRKYDVVMFDEVSMAYVPQIICAATFANEKLICVGDFRQLPPIAQSNAKEILCKDLFSFLNISDGLGHVFAHPWLVMLNEQRRMHPEIACFANRTVYENLLKNHDSVKTNRTAIVKKEPLPGSSTNLIDLTGTYCATAKNADNSRFNILSAVLAFGSAITAETNGEKSVGIITPYAAQTRLVRAMIQDYRKNAETNISCATVHQFQGSERNVVVFDMVESYPSTKTGWLMSKNDNDSVTRLVNVAVTRAKGKLITIANRAYWKNKFHDSENAAYKLIRHLLQHGNTVGVLEGKLHKHIGNLCFGNHIQVFTERSDANKLFEKDVKEAKKKLLVCIPATAEYGENVSHILTLFNATEKRKVKVMIKARHAEKLPQEWLEHTWDCENAVLPTVVVDDEVLWYGFPQETGTFWDGKNGITTKLPIWIRFSGEHTVDLIKSLAALDMRSQNKVDIPMSEKSSGIASYVAENEMCPKCGNAMLLNKTKNNKTNLRCSHCNNTELFTKESINYYIHNYGAVCPYCGKDIYAGVSHYGLYIKCSGGHWPKVEEI